MTPRELHEIQTRIKTTGATQEDAQALLDYARGMDTSLRALRLALWAARDETPSYQWIREEIAIMLRPSRHP